MVIQGALACNHHVRPLDGRFEVEHLGHEIKTRSNGRAAKTHQTKPQSPGRTGAGRLPKIATQISRHDIGQSRQSFFKRFKLFWRRALLRTKCSRSATCSEQRIPDVGRANHREEKIARPRNLIEAQQIGNWPV